MKMIRNSLVLILALILTVPAFAQEKAKPSLDVSEEGGFFTVVAVDTKLSQVLRELKSHVEIDLKVPQKLLDKKITMSVEHATIEEIFEQVAGGQALVYERWGDTYKLVSAQLTTEEEFIEPKLAKLNRKERKDLKAKKGQVTDLLKQHRGIITYAGELDYDAAKALIADRRAKMQDIIDQLAALGPGGARAINEMYEDDVAGIRERQAMIKALALIDDPEASSVLASLYGAEDSYSLQRDILGSLGRRKDADSSAALQNIFDSTDDIRIQAGAVQGMSGREESVPSLTDMIQTPSQPLDVRLEGIRAIGLVGTEEAMNVLADAALNSGNRNVQEAAVQELGRSYGAQSMSVMETLVQSDNDRVRYSVVKALARIASPESNAILQNIAENDPSENVRGHAQSALVEETAN